MRLSYRTWPRLPTRELVTIHVTGAVFALVLVAVLSVGAGLSGRGPSAVSRVEAAPPRTASADLEPLIVAVTGAEAAFQLGSRRFATAEELSRALGPLATSGAPVYVRVSHDVPFNKAAEAIQACQAAGFRSVSFSTDAP